MIPVSMSMMLLGLACGLVGCGESAEVQRTALVSGEAAVPTRAAPLAGRIVEEKRIEGEATRAESTDPRAADVAASPSPATESEGLRSYTEEEDFDGDGVADTRTIRRFKYDAFGRTCRLVTERDFDADGAIDARTTNISAYGDSGTCGT